jgi:hypothetical protein
MAVSRFSVVLLIVVSGAIGGSALAQQNKPARLTDPQFVESARCVAFAKEMKAANAKELADAFRQQRIGRSQWVIALATDAGSVARRTVAAGKNGGRKAAEFEALKAVCAPASSGTPSTN